MSLTKKRSTPTISPDSIPKKIGNIPQCAPSLGMIHPTLYDLYKISKGNVPIEILAKDSNIHIEKALQYFEKLHELKIIEFCT